MWWVFCAAGATPAGATPGVATLHVGIHRDAGGVYAIAADGAAGQCATGPARISCPSVGPVTFRWAGGEGWALTGSTRVAPGEIGTAFVLAAEASRRDALAELDARPLAPEVVQRWFVRSGEAEVPPPSPAMLARLEVLAAHEDPRVRRVVVEALVPLWRHTASDPLPPASPEVVSPSVLLRLAGDPDWKVRRRIASRVRDILDPGPELAASARQALVMLLVDPHPTVRKAATGSLHHAVRNEALPALLSWEYALERVTTEGPPGRAAANTLGRMARHLTPGPAVDPERAVGLVMTHHVERAWHVWKAWREHVPWRADWMDRLLRETVGLDATLLEHFARSEPDALAAALRRWEPDPPHSERFLVVAGWLGPHAEGALREALDLPLAEAGSRVQ